jgi:hypothetical protein
MRQEFSVWDTYWNVGPSIAPFGFNHFAPPPHFSFVLALGSCQRFRLGNQLLFWQLGFVMLFHTAPPGQDDRFGEATLSLPVAPNERLAL